jgi:hypothetical protein
MTIWVSCIRKGLSSIFSLGVRLISVLVEKKVLIDPLLERLHDHEPCVRVIRNQNLDYGEHCDTFWGIDAVEHCYGSIVGKLHSFFGGSAKRRVN